MLLNKFRNMFPGAANGETFASATLFPKFAGALRTLMFFPFVMLRF